jgi:pyruvate/2-oxoglutarate dehydrogenase complex dihydrolipoamide dehydrogenase (E3) component
MVDENDVFDVIVIGDEPAGQIAAARAARGGLSVAIIDRRLAGNECFYHGYVPSKTRLSPIEITAQASLVPRLALHSAIDRHH